MDNDKIYELNIMNICASDSECEKHDIKKKLWKIALEDVDKNYCIDTEYGKVYAAGGYNHHGSWSGLTFNRDTSYAGLLGLNLMRPDEMLVSLKAIRECRKKLGFSCIKGMALYGVPDVKVYDLTLEEFKKIFHKASAVNKTDDVIWIWCTYDLLMKHNISEWKWLYENGKECFERFYNCFYDTADGLYFGQPTFIDVGSNGYPENFGFKTEEAMNNGVWVKATSTNCLYYKALCVMADASARLGYWDESEIWKEKANKLKEAIKKELAFSDGTYTYFKHKNGQLENRRDVLGTAFLILCGVLEEDDAKQVLKEYPITIYGAPLIYPFYDNEKVLHNNSMWPFADTFLLLAAEKAYHKDFTDVNFQILINNMTDGHMREFRNTITNEATGAMAQLWTIAAYINTYIRSGESEILPKEIEIY